MAPEQGKEALQSSLYDLASSRTCLVSGFLPVRQNTVRTIRADCRPAEPDWDLAAAGTVLLLLLMSQWKGSGEA